MRDATRDFFLHAGETNATMNICVVDHGGQARVRDLQCLLLCPNRNVDQSALRVECSDLLQIVYRSTWSFKPTG